MKTQDYTWWIYRANEYLCSATQAIAENRQQMALSNLQHAAEFLLKAGIRYHSGHHPHIRNPYTLRHICRLYIPDLDKIFSTETDEQIRLFALLHPYRYNQEHTPVDAMQLIKVLKKLQQLRQLIQDSVHKGR